jgi:hypothetical protein
MATPKEIKLPIRFDKMGGYFWDADNHMIAMMRGWGWIQYKDNPEELQDSIGEWIAECINKGSKEKATV